MVSADEKRPKEYRLVVTRGNQLSTALMTLGAGVSLGAIFAHGAGDPLPGFGGILFAFAVFVVNCLEASLHPARDLTIEP